MTIQIADQSNGFAEDEETVELAVYYGLNLLAGYSKFPQRGWGQEGLHVLQASSLRRNMRRGSLHIGPAEKWDMRRGAG